MSLLSHILSESQQHPKHCWRKDQNIINSHAEFCFCLSSWEVCDSECLCMYKADFMVCNHPFNVDFAPASTNTPCDIEICVCMYETVHTYMHSCMCVCVCVCVCVHACMRACSCVCMHMYMYVCCTWNFCTYILCVLSAAMQSYKSMLRIWWTVLMFLHICLWSVHRAMSSLIPWTRESITPKLWTAIDQHPSQLVKNLLHHKSGTEECGKALLTWRFIWFILTQHFLL